jgi:hypothetical protein
VKYTTVPQKRPEIYLQSSSHRVAEQEKSLENTPEASSPDVGPSRPHKRPLLESEDEEITGVPSRGKRTAFASLYRSDSDVESVPDSKSADAKRVTRGIARGRGKGTGVGRGRQTAARDADKKVKAKATKSKPFISDSEDVIDVDKTPSPKAALPQPRPVGKASIQRQKGAVAGLDPMPSTTIALLSTSQPPKSPVAPCETSIAPKDAVVERSAQTPEESQMSPLKGDTAMLSRPPMAQGPQPTNPSTSVTPTPSTTTLSTPNAPHLHALQDDITEGGHVHSNRMATALPMALI